MRDWETYKKSTGKPVKILTRYQVHLPKADICRIYVKGREEGRGLLKIEATYKTGIINIVEYLNTKYKEDQFANIVKSHERSQADRNSIIVIAAQRF
jgi:hypothetical protein